MKNLEFNEVKRYVKLVERSDISELEITHEGMTLRIKKELSLSGNTQIAPIENVQMEGRVLSVGETAAPSPPPAVAEVKKTFEVKSPMVGTFYRAISPEADPYIQVGDAVRPGQVLCIIEAMKLMNEIECEVAGRVVEILVENGNPVEFDQVLFRIETE